MLGAVVGTEVGGGFGGDFALAGGIPPTIMDCVGGDSQQPGFEGESAPFELMKLGECVVEDFGSDVFGFGAIANTRGDEGVNAVKMVFVELREVARVTLRRFD